MKEKELNDYMKELMQEKASDSFTDNIMKAIELDAKELKQPIMNRIQGKSILLFLFLLFSVSLIWSFTSSGPSLGYFETFVNYLKVDSLHVNFEIVKFSNITSYAIVGLFIFLWFDILVLNKKRYRIL